MAATAPEMIPLSHDRLESYRQIAIGTFRQTFDQYNSEQNMLDYLDKAFHPDVLSQELDPSRSAVFLAEWDGQTVGYLKLNFPAGFTHPVGPDGLEIERIYVDVNHQGRKFGQALLDKAVAEAKHRGARFLWLGVWEHNQNAIAFYKKKGFTLFGSHPFTLGDEIQTDLLMRLEL